MKASRKILIILSLFLSVCMTGGAYAAWQYAAEDVPSENDTAGVDLGAFFYKANDVLPNDTINNDDYYNLLTCIFENGYSGLNDYWYGRYTIQNICDKKEYGSMEDDRYTNAILDASYNYTLSFLFHYVADDEFHLYMFDSDEVESGWIAGRTLVSPVYKTILRKEYGAWSEKGSAEGYAVAKKYVKNGTVTDKLSIEPTSWQIGRAPNSK